MSDLHDNLDAILDRWKAPPLDRDLTPAVVARAKAEDARLDELLLRTRPEAQLSCDLAGPILARAREADAELDRLLAAAAVAVPPMAADLSRALPAAIRRGRARRRIFAMAGSIAAAAAVTIVALVLHKPSGPFNAQPLSPEDQMVVRNLDLIQDRPVLVHWDTIRALEQLESEAQANSL